MTLAQECSIGQFNVGSNSLGSYGESGLIVCVVNHAWLNLRDAYIRWYNEKRIKISLDSLRPIECRLSLGLTA